MMAVLKNCCRPVFLFVSCDRLFEVLICHFQNQSCICSTLLPHGCSFGKTHVAKLPSFCNILQHFAMTKFDLTWDHLRMGWIKANGLFWSSGLLRARKKQKDLWEQDWTFTQWGSTASVWMSILLTLGAVLIHPLLSRHFAGFLSQRLRSENAPGALPLHIFGLSIGWMTGFHQIVTWQKRNDGFAHVPSETMRQLVYTSYYFLLFFWILAQVRQTIPSQE